jgi:hypothetical protein
LSSAEPRGRLVRPFGRPETVAFRRSFIWKGWGRKSYRK